MIICSLLPLQRLVLGLGPLVATHLVHIELVEADHGTMETGALGAEDVKKSLLQLAGCLRRD